MKLKFGIIGCGRIAKKTMIPALNSSKLAELVMISSQFKEEAEEYCKQINCDFFGTYEDVLANKDIDVVYIALPIGLHAEWVIKAAKAGKHILCEKSSTTSYHLAKKMVNACKKNNVRIMEGFMYKYHPQHAEVKRIIKNNVLGDLINFTGKFGSPFWDEKDIRFNMKLGGGNLNEVACYPISASMMIFNEIPESVFCKLKKYPKLNNIDISANVLLNYSKGKTAYCLSTTKAAYVATYNIWGAKSYLTLKKAYAIAPNLKTKIYVLNERDDMDKIIIPPANQTLLMVDMFCKVIKNRKKYDFESELLAQARVMEAARLSAKEGRLVKLTEIK